ncbi:hypothetical protein [Streptomyces atacamensis]|uniref:hypothetical protein n=1 Tax=Streptomyces atacamensis TaxID=531966 RepID=UPI00399CA434
MTTATAATAADVRPGAAVQPTGPTAPTAPTARTTSGTTSGKAPAPGPRRTRLPAAVASHRPVLPALATVLLVCVPAHRAPGGGATLADAASGVLVVCCAA